MRETRGHGCPYLFTEGGAGDSPAPPGDPPGGLVVMPRGENTAILRSMPLQVPSGGSPGGTGGSPVLPTVNTCVGVLRAEHNWLETCDTAQRATAIELTELQQTRSANFSPLPTVLAGLK